MQHYNEIREAMVVTDTELLQRITTDEQTMAGKPVIRSTRLTVDYVLGLLAHGATMEEILGEYEGLAREDLLACLLFAQRSIESTTFIPTSEAAS